ncbi:MAG: protein kinase, partial [Kofleriaceae bacterium]
MPCLEADTVALLFSDRLSDADRQRVDVHYYRCATCRQLIGAVARGQGTPADDASPAAHSPWPSGTGEPARHVALAAGDAVSRYVVERFLGAGAMGAVYEARDPELGRRVALKIVPGAGARAARLIRE